MLARVVVSMPFYMYLEWGRSLLPLQFERDGYRIAFHPPKQAELPNALLDLTSDVPVIDYANGLQPAINVKLSDGITLGDSPAYKCNILMIDFFKAAFERQGVPDVHKSTSILENADPPLRLVYEIANDMLGRLRTLTRKPHIHLLDKFNSFASYIYLEDDGTPLQVEEGKLRYKFGGEISGNPIGITGEVWEAAKALPPEFVVYTWDSLLLDAQALLPEVGPAIAVANAALEMFIAWALDELQSVAPITKPELWKWIFDRGNHQLEPSINERYDFLLKTLTGKSLKDNKDLWEKYQHLRLARNSFSHKGRPLIGNQEVTRQQADALIKKAREIVEWVEALLPEASRRPDLRRLPVPNFVITKPFSQEAMAFSSDDYFSSSTQDYVMTTDVAELTNTAYAKIPDDESSME